MIAFEFFEIGEDTMQFGTAGDLYKGFLIELSGEGIFKAFIPLHAAAGEMPARAVTMADQQHAARLIYHHALRP